MRRPSSKRTRIRVPNRAELAAPPGSAAGPPSEGRAARVHVLRYGQDGFAEETLDTVGSRAELQAQARVCWVDVDTVEDGEAIEALSAVFGWHSLVLEDMVSLHQRPKAEDYDDFVYVVLLMPSGRDGLPLEQLSLLLGDSYVVTVQAGLPDDALEPVRERIRRARGRIRSADADYLAYAIIDAVVDHYFPIVEALNARLESIESALGGTRGDATVEEIHAIRNDLHTARRAIAATGEAIGRLIRGEAGAVSDTTRVYLRDCQDHCAQLLDALEACAVLSASLMELHAAMATHRTGEGMRILTMIATVFMPLSFIAGVYGMNFDRSVSPLNMPELGWRFGYPFALTLMGGVGFAFLMFFRRRGWLRGRRRPIRTERGKGV